MHKKSLHQDMLKEILVKVVMKCFNKTGNFEQIVKEVRNWDRQLVHEANSKLESLAAPGIKALAWLE